MQKFVHEKFILEARGKAYNYIHVHQYVFDILVYVGIWSIIIDHLFAFVDLYILVGGQHCLQGGLNSPGRQVARS